MSILYLGRDNIHTIVTYVKRSITYRSLMLTSKCFNVETKQEKVARIAKHYASMCIICDRCFSTAKGGSIAYCKVNGLRLCMHHFCRGYLEGLHPITKEHANIRFLNTMIRACYSMDPDIQLLTCIKFYTFICNIDEFYAIGNRRTCLGAIIKQYDVILRQAIKNECKNIDQYLAIKPRLDYLGNKYLKI